MSIWQWLQWACQVTTAIYAVVFALDVAIHLHAGWQEGAHQRDQLLLARIDCQTRGYDSEILAERCSLLRSTPLAVPWQVALHRTGEHLSAKLSSAIQSFTVLLLVAVPAALLVWRWTSDGDHYRYNNRYEAPAPPPTQHPHAMTWSIRDAIWALLSHSHAGSSSAGSGAPTGGPAGPDSKPCIVDLSASSSPAPAAPPYNIHMRSRTPASSLLADRTGRKQPS